MLALVAQLGEIAFQIQMMMERILSELWTEVTGTKRMGQDCAQKIEPWKVHEDNFGGLSPRAGSCGSNAEVYKRSRDEEVGRES